VTGYTGTVHFTKTDGGAGSSVPSDYTFAVGAGGDNGAHTFSATLTTSGNQTITATDTGSSAISGTSGTITLTATSIVVTTTADEQNTNGQCSLREAIINANNNNQSGSTDCAAGTNSSTDVINFSALFNTPQTITLTLGELAINSSLNINGPGANLLTISGNNQSRVFHVGPGTVSTGAKQFVANFTGDQETPANSSKARGGGVVLLNSDETSAQVSLIFSGLSSAQTAAHIHGPGLPGISAPILFPLPNGPVTNAVISPTTQEVADLKAGLHYMNVHSANFPNGEIRGQLLWNPIEETPFFVLQHYYDFLQRLPDPGGYTFWQSQITQCNSDVQCLRNARLNVSNSFFYEAGVPTNSLVCFPYLPRGLRQSPAVPKWRQLESDGGQQTARLQSLRS
jgi:CSLREA domain-containing protein